MKYWISKLIMTEKNFTFDTNFKTGCNVASKTTIKNLIYLFKEKNCQYIK